MNLQSKFGNCITIQTLDIALNMLGGRFTNGQTDTWTDKQTDDPITRCPKWTFQARA